MSVKFEFVLEDADAEALIDILESARLRAFENAMFSGKSLAEQVWWKKHSQYLAVLKRQILQGNKRVP